MYTFDTISEILTTQMARVALGTHYRLYRITNHDSCAFCVGLLACWYVLSVKVSCLHQTAVRTLR